MSRKWCTKDAILKSSGKTVFFRSSSFVQKRAGAILRLFREDVSRGNTPDPNFFNYLNKIVLFYCLFCAMIS